MIKFGTAGMRALMGKGDGFMNVEAVERASQGICNYYFHCKVKRVVIGYDSRHNSLLFAQKSASVFSANGFEVFIFKNLRPTPLVSFATRHLQSSFSIMITASHNTKEYNGYKVFGMDGGQVTSPDDVGIMDEVEKVSLIKRTEMAPIHLIDDQIDAIYLSQVISPMKVDTGEKLHIIYTGLHGTGITLMPKALKASGFTHLSIVEEQSIPNGDFPLAPKPNPEDSSALKLGLDLLEKEEGDLLLVTDPDADRLGVAVRNAGKTLVLNGNQTALILLDYLGRCGDKKGECISSIVTTPLFKKVAKEYGFAHFEVLTGFKYIAERIAVLEKQGKSFLFGAEESYGYLFGDSIRDKDGISSGVLFALASLRAKEEGKNILDFLEALYKRHGLSLEKAFTVDLKEGLMENLRNNPPLTLLGEKIIKKVDYLTPTPLPLSDVLSFETSSGLSVVIRPSGTEPKIKFYLVAMDSAYSGSKNLCENKLQALEKEVRGWV